MSQISETASVVVNFGDLWDEDTEEMVCRREGRTRGQAIAAWACERGDDFINGRARRSWMRLATEAELKEYPDYVTQWCKPDHPDAFEVWVVMPRHFRWNRTGVSGNAR